MLSDGEPTVKSVAPGSTSVWSHIIRFQCLWEKKVLNTNSNLGRKVVM